MKKDLLTGALLMALAVFGAGVVFLAARFRATDPSVETIQSRPELHGLFPTEAPKEQPRKVTEAIRKAPHRPLAPPETKSKIEPSRNEEGPPGPKAPLPDLHQAPKSPE